MAITFGVNAHQAGEPALRLAASLKHPDRPFFVRCDANWYDLQPSPDRYTWEWLDAFFDHADALNLSVYPTLAYSPAWVVDGGPRNTPPPVNAWIRFVRAFGERYLGRCQFVGMWNEPNIPGMYAGNVHQYLHDTLEPATTTLRAIDPLYRICGPDLSTEGPWPSWLRTLLQRGLVWLDVLTVHAYGPAGRAVRDRLREVRRVVQSTDAGDRGIALTEYGWNTARISEDQQANYYDQFLEAAQSLDWLIAALSFNLINEPPQEDGSAYVQWGL